jgi:NAD(P)-dependent dehydrogenase (short-subunit alcohol dehydrogenase family)
VSEAKPPREVHIHLPPESQGEAPGRGRLRGRRILVVGAGQDDRGVTDPPVGNGRAMSLLFAREGARVAVADRNRESAEQTAQLITAQGGEALVLHADVTKPEHIEAMVSAAAEAFGGLDGLVYNVGIGNEMGLANVTPEGWDFAFAVNLRGAALTLKAALPRLSRGSSVVLISSTASLKPGSRIPAYDSSKAALAGLMRHAAFEGSRRAVRVNVVAPGLMDTALGRRASLGRPSRAETPVPLGRQGTGWETAYTSLFLISDESAYVTGQVLTVDGGLSALR